MGTSVGIRKTRRNKYVPFEWDASLRPSETEGLPFAFTFFALFDFYLVDIACFDEQINVNLGNGLYRKGLYDASLDEEE